MLNSTVVAPAEAPAPAEAYNFVPAPSASSPVGTLVTVRRVVNFSWIGIVGLLAAFLVLAIIALVCLWYKKRAYKQALIDQREFFAAKRKASPLQKKPESEDEESEERSKRGQLILADYEKALGCSHTVTSSESDLDITTNASSRKFAGVPEQEISIPVYARDKHVVVSFKETGFNWNLGENLVDEVFYKGEGGSQMGVRYSRTEFDNFEILTQVGEAPKKKKRSESVSASLLAEHCTIAVESPPTKLWTLRTFSLPVYRQNVEIRKVDHSESPNKPVTDSNKPHSLPTSPAQAGNCSLTKASSWTQKPSRLGSQSNAAGASSFVVPPSTPPPPLPLPVTVQEESQTLKESRRVVKVAETSKWSIANYTPFAPPPPLPVPVPSPSLTPATKAPPPPPPPPPPPFPSLPCRRFPQPPSPPPLPTRKPSTPPPSPPCSDDGHAKTAKAPPSPPPLPTRSTPPASPPVPGRPKLAPLVLPGRPDLGGSQEFRRHQKMRPLHWEKLKLESHSTMVWDTISDSMELDDELIENLFGVTTRSSSESEVVKRLSKFSTTERTEILDPKKAHNIAIQLRARGLARATICDALLAGDGLGQENLEVLVKMTPTDEELARFQEYQGDLTLLGPADRFVQGILQIPSAFERLRAMLFKASYWEELHQIQEMIAILEMACKELKGSRTLIKLLEAVLKTGNRLNTGTFRGDARAFKLDTLLKLADVKGVDGKTTLLHFVIQEIMKAEGARAARLAGVRNYDGHGVSSTPTSTRSSVCTSPSSTSSPLSHFALTMETEFDRCQSEITNCGSADAFRRVGMDVVCGIPSELGHVRKAGGLDILALRLAVSRLQTGLQDSKTTVAKLRATDHAGISTYDAADDVFREKVAVFVEDAEAQVSEVQSDLDLVLASVKDISVYFYGETDVAKSTQPALKVFMVMREFLAMLEQACKDVMKANAAAADSSPSKPPSRPRSLVTQSK